MDAFPSNQKYIYWNVKARDYSRGLKIRYNNNIKPPHLLKPPVLFDIYNRIRNVLRLLVPCEISTCGEMDWASERQGKIQLIYQLLIEIN